MELRVPKGGTWRNLVVGGSDANEVVGGEEGGMTVPPDVPGTPALPHPGVLTHLNSIAVRRSSLRATPGTTRGLTLKADRFVDGFFKDFFQDCAPGFLPELESHARRDQLWNSDVAVADALGNTLLTCPIWAT